jgi:hypothetical protein
MVFVRPWNGFAGNGASDALMDRRTLFARMVALHVSSNGLLEQNRIWNRRHLEEPP